MEMQRKQYCESELRDISWDWGHWGRFGTIFGLILYGNTPLSYVSTVSCVWAGVRITLASAGGSACITITPLVRLHQVNRVLIDWLSYQQSQHNLTNYHLVEWQSLNMLRSIHLCLVFFCLKQHVTVFAPETQRAAKNKGERSSMIVQARLCDYIQFQETTQKEHSIAALTDFDCWKTR
jgi:hypothetical protein